MADRPRSFLRRALDESGAGVVFDAEMATIRAAYGDEAVDEALRRARQRLADDVKQTGQRDRR